jgi:ribosomal protein S18 acetylase RimI-like enzyme
MQKLHYIIKLFNKNQQTERIANILLTTDSLPESFSDVANADSSYCARYPKSPIIGFVSLNKSRKSYYTTDVYISSKFRNKGLGKILYKLAMLAAKKHSNKRKFLFACEEADAWFGSTSSPAWRCFKSLKRLGYLKIKEVLDKDNEKKVLFEVQKFAKRLKPIFLNCSGN